MKILKSIKFWLLVIWYFIIGPKKQKKPERLPQVNEFLFRKGKWNRREIIVSFYLKLYDIKKLGLNLEFVAESMGRTEAAMIRKQYRLQGLIDKQPREISQYSKMDEDLYDWFSFLSEEQAEIEFWEAMVYITSRIPTGVEDYWKRRLHEFFN